jgi:monomeric isocitrate dehydrogenase
LKNIHNLDELSAFLESQQQLTIPDSELQWKGYFIPDYSEKESVVAIKAHHVIGDGMACMLCFGVLQDNYSPDQFI